VSETLIEQEPTLPPQFDEKSKGKKSKKNAVKKRVINSYKYSGVLPNGIKKSGTVKAATWGEAQFGLLHEGLLELQIKVYKPWYKMEFGKTVPLETLMQATRQLASFSQAGITAARGIAILAKTTEHKKMQLILEELVQDIEGGATLSESVSRHPHVFPAYYPTILGAAERSGDLVEALVTLNVYLERDLRSKRAVRSAMIYPIVLLALTLVAVTVLSLVVLPRFQVFFDSLKVQLPLTTRMLLNTTHFVSTYWWALGGGLTLSIIGLVSAMRNQTTRYYVDRFLLVMPIFGGLARLVSLERFCRVLATLVKTQVPLPDALELAGKATGNLVFQRAIAGTRTRVLNGDGLAEPLSEYKIFPIAAIQILRIGEESGQLQSQLQQAASFYSDELDHRMKNFTALLEPATLLFIGGGVGFVAVALVSAMYGIYNGVKA
jgi:type IV pilus assembly protein PilC